MKHNSLLKALEPYSGAFLISVIWGGMPENEMKSKRGMISRRLAGKKDFEKLEVEKLNKFLETQQTVISDYLRCV